MSDDTAMAAKTAALASTFYNNGFSDVTVKCQDREWKLHRVILASRCDFFRVCCGGPFKVSLFDAQYASACLFRNS
jgi:hypothetical protein